MAFVAKFVTKKILKEKLANNFGQDDPYFEQVPATRLNGTLHPTKMKKRRKALPPGISIHDGRVLTKVKRRAWRLDMCLFSICGVRFGWGSAIAIVPAIGDVIDALLSLMVLRTCCKIEDGLPSGVRMQMILNIIIDFAIGLVPFAGDIADAMFRCNTKNAVLLEEHLRQKGRKNLRKEGKPIPNIDPSDPDYREELDAPVDPVAQQPRRNDTMGRNASTREGRSSRRDRQRSPAVAEAPESRESGGFMNWLWTRHRDPDPEMGRPAPPIAEEPSRRHRDDRY